MLGGMRRKRSTTHSAARTPRPAGRIREELPGKIAEFAACPHCTANYRNGRWTWHEAPADATEHVCPACKRIEDDDPAGVLHASGEFAELHRDELIQLIRNIEKRERTEHPLKRIMNITDEDGGFGVTVTDSKLAEAFGQALKNAYDGLLERPPTTSDKQNLVRVRWTRD